MLPLRAGAKERLVWLGSPKVLPVALALIPDDRGRYLLLHARYSGAWLLPGGVLHPGEAPRAGLRRECREELGHELGELTLLGWVASGPPGQLAFVYACAPLPGSPRLGPEHDTYRYRAWAALPARLRRTVAAAHATAVAERLAVATPGAGDGARPTPQGARSHGSTEGR